MYGLVGKELKHSFSKEIHRELGNSDYQLFSTNSLSDFIQNNPNLSGFNVTIPYKTDIISYLDGLDPIARETFSVNTVVNENGKKIGYNTDYYGLQETLRYYNVDVKNKKILILGNGSVSKTVGKLMDDLTAQNVVRLCRSVRSGNDFLFSDFHMFLHYDIIINTTPIGMYPHNDDILLIDIGKFHHLECVIDLVYNPLRTKIMIEAEKQGIKAINGLYMLVMQAIKAYELFFHKKIPLNVSNKLYRKIYKKHLNIVFVGLPLSGKSKYTKLLSIAIRKKGLDTDDIIEKENKKSIPDIFEQNGEQYFRKLEEKVVLDLFKLQNLIISTGGGLIENQDNVDRLKQNGLIIFLNKDPNKIAQKKIYGRPLLKNASDILKLAERRIPIYQENSDYIINIEKNTEEHLQEIKEYINEYISR